MDKPLRILIVEDSENDAWLMLRQLRRGGYDPTYERVETPQALQAALDRQTWDVVLSDYVMPQFSGLAALKLLQETGLDLPFIIVSGQIGEGTAVDAMKAGAHDYLLKDRLARLAAAVEQALREARVRQERRQMEEQIRANLREKEVLLKEVHHRAKNNLQLIDSLLSMQARRTVDPATREVLANCQSRLHSMALIHQLLYQSEFLAEIDFANYVRVLVGELHSSQAVPLKATRLEIDIEDISLNLETAVPSGLLINELVTNALKYAFPDGREGTIRIAFKSLHGSHLLSVCDDGVGLPEDMDSTRIRTLGLRLVQILAEQLKGHVEFSASGRGTGVSVTFPIQAECRR